MGRRPNHGGLIISSEFPTLDGIVVHAAIGEPATQSELIDWISDTYDREYDQPTISKIVRRLYNLSFVSIHERVRRLPRGRSSHEYRPTATGLVAYEDSLQTVLHDTTMIIGDLALQHIPLFEERDMYIEVLKAEMQQSGDTLPQV